MYSVKEKEWVEVMRYLGPIVVVSNCRINRQSWEELSDGVGGVCEDVNHLLGGEVLLSNVRGAVTEGQILG